MLDLLRTAESGRKMHMVGGEIQVRGLWMKSPDTFHDGRKAVLCCPATSCIAAQQNVCSVFNFLLSRYKIHGHGSKSLARTVTAL